MATKPGGGGLCGWATTGYGFPNLYIGPYPAFQPVGLLPSLLDPKLEYLFIFCDSIHFICDDNTVCPSFCSDF